ncbi:MAG: dihydroneopterin aldolase family protein [Thermoplasmatota archaeon]
MKDKMEKKAESFFKCNDNERVAFELGIKLGALFHQFIGAPVSSKNIDILERAIEKTTERQAFVKKAEVKIIPKELDKRPDTEFYDYTTLSGDMLQAKVTIEYKDIIAVGRLKYVEELDYPLMYIESIG